MRKKPNIILIILDSARRDMFGCYGNLEGLTPNLDQLADRGLLLMDHYAAGNGSAPAHVSIFTGHHPARHKVFNNYCDIGDDIRALPSILKRFGYRNYGHTKFSVVPPSGYGSLFGFDEMISPENSQSIARGGLKSYIVSKMKSNPDLWIRFKNLFDRYMSQHRRMRLISDNFDGRASLTYLLGKIKENKGIAPVFAYSTLLHPHMPYYPPRAFLNKVFKGQEIDKISYNIQFNLHAYINGDFGEARDAMECVRKCYKADLLYADYLLKEFIDSLKREGLFDNTLLLIMADHGELLGEHGDINHGVTVWEELLSIPCMLYYPEKIEPNSKTNKLTSGLDIVPTILDLIGALKSARAELVLDGHSIFDERVDWEDRYLVVDSPPVVLPERLKAYPNTLYKQNIISRALRTKNYKYIWQSNGEKYLFRTGISENRENNILDKNEELAMQLHQTMISYYKGIDANSKIDEYPITLSRKAAKITRNPMVREELRRLGYLK
ncbi:MAG: sulfatase [Thermodesulfobacteriota bacterium]